jgi:hypothetical protein
LSGLFQSSESIFCLLLRGEDCSIPSVSHCQRSPRWMGTLDSPRSNLLNNRQSPLGPQLDLDDLAHPSQLPPQVLEDVGNEVTRLGRRSLASRRSYLRRDGFDELEMLGAALDEDHDNLGGQRGEE